MSQTHSVFLVEQVARIIHYYKEPDPKLIKLSIDDEWLSYTEQEKSTWQAKAIQWLDSLSVNHPTSYAELVAGIIAPQDKFW